MSVKIFCCSSVTTGKFFYGTTKLSLHRKIRMLERNFRLRQEKRLKHSPYLSAIFPNVEFNIIETHDTREQANERIEELRKLNPEECLNKPSTIYGDLKEYKKKKNEERIYCHYCQKEYRKDYWAEHIQSKKHIINSNLTID